MKKFSHILAIAALSISTAALTVTSFAASATQEQPLPIQQTIRHDMPNYVITDSSSYAVSKALIANGKKLDIQPFTTTWDAKEHAVTIVGPSMKTTQYLGVDFSNAVTIIPGATGMTAPTSFGAPPVLVNNTAYVPAEIFQIIQGNNPDTLVVTDTTIEINARPN